MTSIRRGREIRLRWMHLERWRGSSHMWMSTQEIKIRVHLRHPVFFSYKEIGIFLKPEFGLWTE